QIEPGTAKVDLLFGFEEHRAADGTPAGVRGRLEFSHDLFEPATAQAIVRRLERVLDSVLADPDLPIDEIDVLSADERVHLLHELNDTRRPAPSALTHELFETRAADTPHAPAMLADGAEISYTELNGRANRLARRLVEAGVGPERLVVLALPRSADLVVAVLAVLKAGGAYLPIGPEYPAERVRAMIADARPVLVLTHESVAAGMPAIDVPVLAVDNAAVRGEVAAYPAAKPKGPVRPENPAYVIYTSGSTGVPKGVVIEHRTLAQYLDYAGHEYPSVARRALLHSPVSFDMAVTTLLAPLVTGGCVHVAELEQPAGDVRQPDFCKVTPSHLGLLATSDPAYSPSGELVIGGEQLLGESLARWREAHPDVAIINEYGPTEATVGCVVYRLDPGTPLPQLAFPVGRPTWNTQVYLLDANLAPVPYGSVGELYLGGGQLSRGYLRRPGLTASRFVANAFATDGSRLYRTGDLARWDAQGQLVYLGRSDEQVKLRGFRIELGEVESVLAAATGVAAAAVVVREDQPGLRRLVGYVVPEGDALELAALRDWVSARLPEYMVPAALVELDALPLSRSGKLDRGALPRPAAEHRPAGRTSGGVEENILLALFAELLGVTNPGVDDGFFELGGDSIVSIQLVAKARRAGLDLMPKDVFAEKTVARLATLAGRRATTNRDTTPARPADDGTGPVRLTPIMHWWRERSGVPDGINQTALVLVPAGLALSDLTGALRVVLDHHDILRLRADNGFAFEVGPRGQVRAEDVLARVDVAGLDDAARDRLVAEHATAARGRLSAENGVLLQGVWFEAGAGQRSRLLLVAHHLVVDGVSWRILLEDLQAAAEAVVAGEQPDLPPVGTSYRRWAELLAANVSAAAAELPVWLDVVRPGSRQLADRPLDPARDVTGTARELTRMLPAAATERLLTRLPSAFHATVNDVLLTALSVAVADWQARRGHGGGADLVVDVEGHGREHLADDVDLTRTVGWFTSIYPVRLGQDSLDLADFFAGGMTVRSALRTVKERIRTLPRNGIGFGMLRYLDPAAAAQLSTMEQPQLLVNYLGRLADEGDAEWVPLAESQEFPGADPQVPLSHPLELNVVARDGADGPRLFAAWTWPADLFAETAVEDLANTWFRALEAMAAHAERPDSGGHSPSDLTLVALSQEDIDSLEAEWRTLQ
ncbi:MAG TPA: amino acid adenylation domain-containing protein, partial [Actinophytocola sp.]|nr:amino acid adenylation domain-containing protein [Actinophytocola sp.]